MSTEILPIPRPVPREIIDAAAEGKLVVFIGAGVSRLVGSMGWEQLARNLVEKCYKTTRPSGDRCISFRERDILRQETDHKKTITICHHILETNGAEDGFYQEFEQALDGTRPSSESANIYRELVRLPAVFVTTNADTHFGCDPYFRSERILYTPASFDPSRIEPRKLYQIHGVKTDRKSLVFTVDQYITQYNNPDFVRFMKCLFSQYVILFMGYGLGEFELLDFLFTKYGESRRADDALETRHFALLPYFRDDVNILGFDQSYYGRLRIKVLGYQKDVDGYEQLYYVVKEWNKEILQVSPFLPQTLAKIDQFIASPSDDRLSWLLQTIRNDEASHDHFFREVTKIGNPVRLFEPLRGEHYFDPTKNPAPQEDPKQKGYYFIPGWRVLPYLESVAQYNQRQPCQEVTDGLLTIIGEIAEDEAGREEKHRNYYTERSLTRIIANLPRGAITQKHIEYIAMFLHNPWYTGLVSTEIGNALMPRLLGDNETALLLKVLDVILAAQKRDGEYVALVEGFSLAEILGKQGPKIVDICGVEVLRVLFRGIHSIVDSDKSAFNNVWIRSIETPSEPHTMYRYENILISFARTVIEQLKPAMMISDVKALLAEEHPIFWRLGFFAVASHYDALKSLFWGFASNPLDRHIAKPEMYSLLASHCKSFTPEEICQILGWIESSSYYLPEGLPAESNEAQKRLAYQKKEWLSALLEGGDDRVRALFSKYDGIAPGKIDHPGQSFWTESRVGRPPSGLSWADLIQRSDGELVETLNGYVGSDGWHGPTRADVASEFAAQVAENPLRFVEHIGNLTSLDHVFKLSLFSGLKDAWAKGKEFPWDHLLQLMRELVVNETLMRGEQGEQYARAIAALIRVGTAQDSHAFNSELLPLAEVIVLRLVDLPASDVDPANELIHAAINSAKYDVLSALLNYALRLARLGSGESEVKWPLTVRSEFSKRLDRNAEPSNVYPFFVGEHLPNLLYLDRNWVATNLQEIFPSSAPDRWIATFIGYVAGTDSVYEELYKPLRSAGHYHRAISTDFPESHINDRVTDHVCIGYLRGWEDLADGSSLISTILTQSKADRLSEIVDAFWRWRDNAPRWGDKVRPLWRKLYEILLPQKDISEFRKPMANLHWWLCLTDTIDCEVKDWTKISVDCLDHSWDAHLLVEYLATHVQKSAQAVGEIYLHMLGKDLYPDYKKEDIVCIVEGLYRSGCEEQANRICNMYLGKGHVFLREIYEKNQPRAEE